MEEDIFSLLESEHEDIRIALQEVAAASPGLKKHSLAQLKKVLVPHARAEEKTLYAFIWENVVDSSLSNLLKESYVEHMQADDLLGDLERMDVDDPSWNDKFLTLKKNVEQHIDEEEAVLFVEVKKHLSSNITKAMLKAYEAVEERFEKTCPLQSQISSKRPAYEMEGWIRF